MVQKSELVLHMDIGLVGSFCRWVEKASEQGYKYLEYYPLNSFPPKKVLLKKPIHEDHIHTLHSPKNEPGIEPRIIFIYTGEAGSLLKNVLKDDSVETIATLRERIRKLLMDLASTKQSESDARTGVNKQIANMKQVQRGNSSMGNSGFNPYPQPYHHNNNDDEFESF